LGDKASIPQDAHGCPLCPHPGVGPAIRGSLDVLVNKRPALRVDDPGIHAACCGRNTWQANAGSETVFINGKAAHRIADQTKHCGGYGRLVEGSPNVIVGNDSASSAGRGDLSNTIASADSLSSSRFAATGALHIDLDLATQQARDQADALRAAAAAHMPFCEECARRSAEARP
jgi:uncharacterized Zn-binding protein involved in type VI secretion